MAVDKKTLLRDALKQVQAGKIDKAVETYKALIKIDPRDASVHNTLGDLFARLGKKKEAIAEYLDVAAMYEKDGFALRAVAMNQKALNLDPGQIAVRIKLGELYASQKLPAEGRAHYMLVADYYDKKGDVASALEIFRKIADLDPGNLSVRLKLAGMFEKQKFPEKAADEYVRAAQGYTDKKEMDTAVQLYVRAFKLFPGNSVARRRLADFYAQRQDWPVVVGLLETPAAQGSRDTDLLVLYGEALTKVNHPKDAVKVLEGVHEREPNSLPVIHALGRAYLKAGEVEKGTATLNRGVSVHLTENRFEPAEALLREMAEAAPDDDAILQRVLEVAQKHGDKVAIAKAYLRLAALYEKKKLVRSATGAIEKYLELNPGDAAATQRLALLHAQTPAPKVEAPAPPTVVSPAPAPPPAEEEDSVELNLEEDEEELIIEVESDAPAAPTLAPTSVAEAMAIIRQCAPAKASEFLEEHLGRNPGDIEAWQALTEARRQLGDSHGVRDGFLRLANLHRGAAKFDEARAAYKGALDADPRSTAAVRGLADLLIEEETAAAPPSVTPVDAEEELSIDLFDQAIEEVEAEPETVIHLPPEPEPAPESASEPTPEPIPEPEPVAELKTVLELESEPAPEFEPVPAPELAPVPESEPVPAPVTEPGPAFGSAPVTADEVSLDEFAPEAQPPAPPTYEEFTLDDFGEEAAAFGTLTAPTPSPVPAAAPVQQPAAVVPGATDAPSATGTGEIEEFLAEADFYFQQGLIDEAEFLYSKLLRLAPGHPVLTMQLRKLKEMRAASSPPPAADDFVNLDEELTVEPPSGEEGLKEIFQEFQRSVKEQLGDEDFETHYNLGIAYKEMGLMDEAIAELMLAEKSPVRRLDAVSMIALCLREMGRFDEAALRLRTGISLAVEGSEDQKGFLYDLASLHEQAGRATAAQETLQRLLSIDPGYRDVAARVGAVPPATGTQPRKKSKVSYL